MLKGATISTLYWYSSTRVEYFQIQPRDVFDVVVGLYVSEIRSQYSYCACERLCELLYLSLTNCVVENLQQNSAGVPRPASCLKMLHSTWISSTLAAMAISFANGASGSQDSKDDCPYVYQVRSSIRPWEIIGREIEPDNDQPKEINLMQIVMICTGLSGMSDTLLLIRKNQVSCTSDRLGWCTWRSQVQSIFPVKYATCE